MGGVMTIFMQRYGSVCIRLYVCVCVYVRILCLLNNHLFQTCSVYV